MAVLTVSFPEDESEVARTNSLELRQQLLNSDLALDADVVKDRDDTADLGSILQIVLVSPAFVEVAKELASGIADWIRARAARRDDEGDVTLVLELDDGRSLSVSGNAEEVQGIVQEWLASTG